MQASIHKFVLPIVDAGTVKIKGLESVLSVIKQRNTIVLYAMVNLEDPNSYLVEYAIRGTGMLADGVFYKNMKFMGTIDLMDEDLIFHVFVQKAWCYLSS